MAKLLAWGVLALLSAFLLREALLCAVAWLFVQGVLLALQVCLGPFMLAF